MSTQAVVPSSSSGRGLVPGQSAGAAVCYGETPPIADAFSRLSESFTDPEESGVAGFITEEQLARQLGVTLSTIRRWKSRGYGPKFVKIGRRDYCKESGAADFAAELMAAAEDKSRRRRARQRRSR
jgi:hypothetical protein